MDDIDSQPLPLFYKDLVPLNSRVHADFRSRTTDKASWLAGHNAVPLTTDEFAQAQRFFPIVFSAIGRPVPLALMGLNEGRNVFVQDDGGFDPNLYVPAYVRRYPFLLARLDPSSEDLSLCFDPNSNLVGTFEEGDPLFDGDDPAERCKSILNFCERFEVAGRQTSAFVDLLEQHDLLADGEITIQREAQPSAIYRGFKMVTDEKLRALSQEALVELGSAGALSLIHLHQASLGLITEIFVRQSEAA